MKRIICKVLIVVSVLVFAGCGNGVPEGTDDDVKDLVISISKDAIRNSVAPTMYTKVTSVPVAMLGMNVTYDSLVNDTSDPDNQKVVAQIDEFIAGLTITLSNIRPESVDKEIGKSTSSADFTANGNVTQIKYTAQYNTEGELYVEVFGL